MNKKTPIEQMIDFINDINDNDRSEFDYYHPEIIEKLEELLEEEKKNKYFKIRVVLWPNNPERTSVIDETNFYPRYFLGLNGRMYENYEIRPNEKPVWEAIFDADYEIQIIPRNE
jgi:hypothetical protein